MKLDNYGKYVLDDGQRGKIGQRLKEYVDAGLSERSGRSTRWEENMLNYEGQNDFAVPFLDGATCPSFNIVGPRVNALVDNMVGHITTMSPMMIAEMRGSTDRLEDVEECVGFFQDLAYLDMKLRQIGTLAAIFGIAFTCTTYDNVVEGIHGLQIGQSATIAPGDTRIAYSGLHIGVISPQDFIVVRSANCDLQTSPCHGHKTSILRRDVKVKQLIGRYYETPELSMESQPWKVTDQSDKITPADTGNTLDEPIAHYSLILRAKPSELFLAEPTTNEAEMLFDAQFAYEDAQLLSLKPYRLKKSRYTAWRLKTPMPGNIWPAGSVANDLQALQSTFNHLTALQIFGGYAHAFPAVATNGNPNQSKKLSPNQLVFMDGTEIEVITNDFKGDWIPAAKEAIERLADAQVGVSQGGLAQEFSANTTATEVEQVSAGQSVRLQGYGAQFSVGLEELTSLCCEILYLEREFWSRGLYGDQIKVTPELIEDLAKPIRWTVTGKRPDSTPRSMLEKYKLLLQMANSGQEAGGIAEMAAAFMAELGIAPEIIEQFMTSAQGMEGPFDVAELYKSIVNNLQLPNASKVFRKEQNEPTQPEPSGPGTPTPIGNASEPGLAFAQALGGFADQGANQFASVN